LHRSRAKTLRERGGSSICRGEILFLVRSPLDRNSSYENPEEIDLETLELDESGFIGMRCQE